ncbi:MAG: RNA 2',3'-cyclic phosphodiesterase [Ktedonobacteraceae bacterium]|nr:RNA 2',3'-cyclic phosphodiesterase [Ktedonobacteraceae bacterium]
MTRTFIALDLHTSLQRFLGEVIRQGSAVLPAVSWVNPTSIHLTLAFLGELSDEQLAQARQATEAASEQISPFEYRLSRLGTFGSPRQPRVIWMGLGEPSARLVQLHRALQRELELRGFEVDRRPLAAHLTLARIKSPLSPDQLQSLHHFLQTAQVPSFLPPQAVAQVNVMKSELSRSGACYTCLWTYTLDTS